MKEKKCQICEKSFKVWKYREGEARFCSYECYWQSLAGKPNLGNAKRLTGKFGTNSIRWRGGKPKCSDCGKGLSNYHNKRCKKCVGVSISGNNNPRWKGGYENRLMLARKRRIKKMGNGGSHTLSQWEELKMQYDYMCLCCKRREPEISLSEDHIIPVSKGGDDNIENIQPLCRNCNSRKHISQVNYKQSIILT